ncbi:MAG: LptF/LptG family permease [Endomicrobia bacterium]|nr:LptF/LptG family permease [Endomicrobiia bacterium]
MKILTKYICYEFIKLFFPIISFLIVIFGLSEFFWRLPDFISHKSSILNILYYLALHIPLWFVQTLPIGLMLTFLLLFTGLTYTKEILSIKILGVNTKLFFLRFISIGVLLSIISFLTYEHMSTKYFNKAQVFFNSVIKKMPKIEQQLKNLFYYDNRNNSFIFIEEFDQNSKILKNCIIEYYRNNSIELQLILPIGEKKYKTVEFKNCIMNSYRNGQYYSQKNISRYIYTLPIDIEEFQYDYTNMQLEQKNISEIKKIIQVVKYKGEPINRFITEINFRYVIAFLNLIVVLLSIPLAQLAATKYGSLISFIYALIILIVYWIFLSTLRVICEAGILHYTYIWLPNTLLFLMSVFLYNSKN